MILLKKILKKIYYFGLVQLFIRTINILYHLFIYLPIHHSDFVYLKKYQNIHKGERCFIVATGPSLTMDDINKLKGEICFGMNSVYKLFDKSEWRPQYYCIFDGSVYRKIANDLKDVSFNCAFYTDNIDWNASYAHKIGIWGNWRGNTAIEKFFFPDSLQAKQERISRDITRFVYAGTSVVHIIMQICFYMGFKEIYLIGADCDFSGNEKQSKIVSYNRNQLPESPAYIYKCLMRDYNRAKKYATQNNIKIYNATRGGKLELFPRVDLDKVLG